MDLLPRFTPPSPEAPPLPAVRCPICTFAVVVAAAGWIRPWGETSRTFLHQDCYALAYTLVVAARSENDFLHDVVRARELARVGARNAPDALAMKRALHAKKRGDASLFERLTAGLPPREVKELIRQAEDVDALLEGLANVEALDALDRGLLAEHPIGEGEPDVDQDAKDAAARDGWYADKGVDHA